MRFRELDDAALALVAQQVALLDRAELALPTPCAGWNVGDLLHHMNERHEAMAVGVLGAAEAVIDDPRGQFAISAARWTLAVDTGPSELRVPGMADGVAKEQVQAVHFLDMVVHGWDLAVSLGRPVMTPTALVTAALPIAEFANAPGSPLAGSAYQPPFAAPLAASPIDRLVAMLGRDPAWRSPKAP